MGYDQPATGPGWVTVQVPATVRPVLIAHVRREALHNPPATRAERETTVTDKQQLNDYQQWRADRLANATDPDTGEKVPTDVRAGDVVTVDPSVQTSRSSSRKS